MRRREVQIHTWLTYAGQSGITRPRTGSRSPRSPRTTLSSHIGILLFLRTGQAELDSDVKIPTPTPAAHCLTSHRARHARILLPRPRQCPRQRQNDAIPWYTGLKHEPADLELSNSSEDQDTGCGHGYGDFLSPR